MQFPFTDLCDYIDCVSEYTRPNAECETLNWRAIPRVSEFRRSSIVSHVTENIRATLQNQVLGPKSDLTDCETVTFGPPKSLAPLRDVEVGPGPTFEEGPRTYFRVGILGLLMSRDPEPQDVLRHPCACACTPPPPKEKEILPAAAHYPRIIRPF
ncbi:hypothetical protein TNCV_4509551 [Trichonephila clavipes]|nr:hypothetical protein TNCV_4509551 [Trichonephila clavipes]